MNLLEKLTALDSDAALYSFSFVLFRLLWETISVAVDILDEE